MQKKDKRYTNQNMNLIRDEISEIEQNTDKRFKNVDDKLNMLLVFNAALLLLVELIIPNKSTCCLLYYLRWNFFILFIGLNIVSIISIFLGMRLRNFSGLNVNNLDTEDLYNMKYSDLLHNFIKIHKEKILTKRNSITKKQSMFKLAMIINIINVFICAVSIIINLL